MGEKKRGFRGKLRRYFYMAWLPCHRRRLKLIEGTTNGQDVAQREKKRTVYRREDKCSFCNMAHALYKP
jgi:hypothetical protein